MQSTHLGEVMMKAMRAESFTGYRGLKLVDLPKPTVSNGKVLLRMTAAGVTPLDHAILSGRFHHSRSPLVLGNEGAAVGGGGRRKGLSCRLTRDVLGYLWRF
jgi:NADPH2:quinone reductase